MLSSTAVEKNETPSILSEPDESTKKNSTGVDQTRMVLNVSSIQEEGTFSRSFDDSFLMGMKCVSPLTSESKTEPTIDFVDSGVLSKSNCNDSYSWTQIGGILVKMAKESGADDFEIKILGKKVTERMLIRI